MQLIFLKIKKYKYICITSAGCKTLSITHRIHPFCHSIGNYTNQASTTAFLFLMKEISAKNKFYFD
jgi:hypothetical protein